MAKKSEAAKVKPDSEVKHGAAAPVATEVKVDKTESKDTKISPEIKSKTAKSPLKAYKCHKIVNAGKIVEIIYDRDLAEKEVRETDGSAVLKVNGDKKVVEVKVDRNWVKRNGPILGGYLVVYTDGYQSFSPAAAFEEGYSPKTTTQNV